MYKLITYIYINRPTYSICIPFCFHHVSFLKYEDWYSGLWCKPDLLYSTMERHKAIIVMTAELISELLIESGTCFNSSKCNIQYGIIRSVHKLLTNVRD